MQKGILTFCRNVIKALYPITKLQLTGGVFNEGFVGYYSRGW